MPYSLNNYLTKINSEPLAWVGGTMPLIRITYFIGVIPTRVQYIKSNRMKTFNEERILDYISTKGGRSIPKPTFGDKITIEDWYVKKDQPVVKRKKVKLTCHQKLVRAGYVRTYIECSLGIVVLSRVVVFRECSKIYRGVKSVYYGTDKDTYSQMYHQ